ncbi:reverse transcriptase, partial [Hamiltosporidium magnivora]
ILNSKPQRNNNDQINMVEFDLKIEGTEITMKEKIKKIKYIKKELSMEWIEHFEYMSETNGWGDKQMGLIAYKLIDDEDYKESLTKTSYLKLKKEILEIAYPLEMKRKLVSSLDEIKQTELILINEYYGSIIKTLKPYSFMMNFSKNEYERKLEETFIKGLGENTELELIKQRRRNKSLKEVIGYLETVETGLLCQLNRRETSTNTIESTSPKTEINYKAGKWCTHHKSRTHNTKECNLLKNYNKKEEPSLKNLVLKQYSESDMNIERPTMINGRKTNVMIDSGSNRNYVNHSLIKEFDLKTEECKPIRTIFGSGSSQISDKKAIIDLVLNEKNSYKTEFYVLQDSPIKILLGNEFLINNKAVLDFKDKRLTICGVKYHLIGSERDTEELMDERLIDNICATTNDEELINILKRYNSNNNNFKSILNIKASLNFNSIPVQSKQVKYSVPFKYREAGMIEINRLLKEDIIEKSNSDFVSPAFFIEKKNKELRLVVDYKKMNKYINDDTWFIPNVEESIMNMGENNYFSRIDLRNGFNQIVLEEESKKFTSFFIMGRQWQYKRIPFGIKLGPKMFQRIISNMLENIKNCFIYIDDIIIYAKTRQEHVSIILEVLKILYKNNVKINFDKSEFFRNEMEILGFVVNNQGIHPKQSYFENKIFYKDIKTKRDVQKLLGVLNWYRKFIPNLSRRIIKLTDLLKKDKTRFSLNEELRNEINEIKKSIGNNHRLHFPDYNKKFRLETDASDLGMGSVLMQDDKIIGYFSRKFKKTELNYTIVEKEYLAILMSMIHFKTIIQGTYVEIFTDSKN